MPKKKKSKIDDIDHLRQILDNPFDSKDQKSFDQQENKLDSLRKRLSKETSKSDTKPSISDFVAKDYDGLAPRVTVHEKDEKIKFTKTEEEKPEEIKETEKTTSEDDLFDDVDLYEIDKPDYTPSEFVEVISKEKKKEKELVFLPTTDEIDKKEDESEELPEFKSIEEEKAPEEEVEKEIKEEQTFIPIEVESEKQQEEESIKEKEPEKEETKTFKIVEEQKDNKIFIDKDIEDIPAIKESIDKKKIEEPSAEKIAISKDKPKEKNIKLH